MTQEYILPKHDHKIGTLCLNMMTKKRRYTYIKGRYYDDKKYVILMERDVIRPKHDDKKETLLLYKGTLLYQNMVIKKGRFYN